MARLIPLSKVSARLATSDDTVRRMMTRGQLPIATYQLPTGTLRFDADELEQWLEKCRRDNVGVETKSTTNPKERSCF